MVKPLCIDLFCGMMGFGRAAAAEGYRVVGFDIEHLPHHGPVPPGCELVLQDVRTLHGSQFKDAAIIVASPPCQKYSWLAMPWSRSKSPHSQKAKALRAKWESEGPDNELFAACFRLQGEASEAAGRYIPLVVENVRGAQEWVGAHFYGLEAWKAASLKERWRMGRSAWNFGSFHLWGDVPALMPISNAVKLGGGRSWSDFGKPDYKPFGFNTENEKALARIRHEDRGVKEIETDRGDTSWFGAGKRADPRDVRRNADGEYVNSDGTKIGGEWFSDPTSTCRKHGSRSSARKAASAKIAEIPEALASHIARVYKPREH